MVEVLPDKNDNLLRRFLSYAGFKAYTARTWLSFNIYKVHFCEQ